MILQSLDALDFWSKTLDIRNGFSKFLDLLIFLSNQSIQVCGGSQDFKWRTVILYGLFNKTVAFVLVLSFRNYNIDNTGPSMGTILPERKAGLNNVKKVVYVKYIQGLIDLRWNPLYVQSLQPAHVQLQQCCLPEFE